MRGNALFLPSAPWWLKILQYFGKFQPLKSYMTLPCGFQGPGPPQLPGRQAAGLPDSDFQEGLVPVPLSGGSSGQFPPGFRVHEFGIINAVMTGV
jgi:hypothetical protein